MTSISPSSLTTSAAFRHYVRQVLTNNVNAINTGGGAGGSAAAVRLRPELPRIVTSSSTTTALPSSAHQQLNNGNMYCSSIAAIHDLAKCDDAFSFSFAEDTQFGHLFRGSGEISTQRMVIQLEKSRNQLVRNRRDTTETPTYDAATGADANIDNNNNTADSAGPRTQWKGILLKYPYAKTPQQINLVSA